MIIPTSWTDTGLTWETADPMWPTELLIPCLATAIKERDGAVPRDRGTQDRPIISSLFKVLERYTLPGATRGTMVWRASNYKGDFNVGTNYLPYDYVVYNNTFWVARLSTNGGIPGISATWEKMQYAVGLYTSLHGFDALAIDKPFKVFFDDVELVEVANVNALHKGSWCFSLILGSGRYRVVMQPSDSRYNNLDLTMPEGFMYEGKMEVQRTEDSEKELITWYNPLRPSIDYVTEMHSAVSYLIPYFINKLDHGGDYTGLATLPIWTEATILTAIGDATRVVPTHLGTLSAWFLQAYKILNLLLWNVDYGVQVSRQFRSSTLGAYGSWYTAEFMSGYMGYISALWYNNGYDGYAYYIGQNQGGAYFKRLQRTIKRFSTNGNCQASRDIYRFSEKSPWAPATRYWYPLPKSPNENAWSLVSQLTEALSVEAKTYDDDEVDGHQLEPALNTSYSNAVNSQEGFLSVSKFDGPNGFKFKNW